MSKHSKNNRSRVNILATLGAELHRRGIGYEDRDALRAVLSEPVSKLLILEEESEEPELTVGDAIASRIANHNVELTLMGKAVLHDRERQAYAADCASWEAQTDAVKQGKWRTLPPTRDQWMMMLRIASKHAVPLPGDINRGAAQEWISAHGGNPRFSKEQGR